MYNHGLQVKAFLLCKKRGTRHLSLLVLSGFILLFLYHILGLHVMLLYWQSLTTYFFFFLSLKYKFSSLKETLNCLVGPNALALFVKCFWGCSWMIWSLSHVSHFVLATHYHVSSSIKIWAIEIISLRLL